MGTGLRILLSLNALCFMMFIFSVNILKQQWISLVDQLHALVVQKIVTTSHSDIRQPVSQLCNPCFFNKPRPLPKRDILFLHFPKCGSSFHNTVFHYICPKLPEDCYFGPGWAEGCFLSNGTKHILKKGIKWLGCEDEVHVAVRKSYRYGHQPLHKLVKGRYAAIFRSPTQRFLSNPGHPSGLTKREHSTLREIMLQAQFAQIAQMPGRLGCQTKMLAGKGCGAPLCDHFETYMKLFNKTGYAETQTRQKIRKCEKDALQKLIPEALKNVEELAFVGLQERWNDSICLFHAMMGTRPLPIEFLNNRPWSGRGGGPPKSKDGKYDENILEGFIDYADEKIYSVAISKFQQKMRDHTTCDV